MSHFLSFIIPCYNCADTVGEAIESIYQQTLDIPFEVICTDDGSEDSTREVLSYYQNKHSNLNVYHHGQNMGVYGGAIAANTCVANSKGDLIFRLDADNILAPESVSGLIRLLDEVGCDGAAVGELRYFEGSKGNYKHNNSWFYEAPNNIFDISQIISTTRTPAASGNYLYTRKSFDRVGGYPNVGLDSLGFGFRQHATGGKIAILPGTFYWHRLSDNSCWMHDEKRGVNGKYGATIFREFPELFTNETNRFLANPDCEKDFFKHLENGLLKTVPEQSLAYLFQGYREQHDRRYPEAMNSFARAIHFGCKHWKVVWCLSQVAYNAGNMNLAQQAAEAVMELAPDFTEAKDLLQQMGFKPEQQIKSKNHRITSNPAKSIDDDFNALKDIQIYHDEFVFNEVGFDNPDPQTNGEYAILSHLIRPSDIVFDVGANKGTWSKHVLSTILSVQIHSFEAIPDTFSILKNTLNHPSVFLHNIAISDSEAQKTFFYYNKNSNVAQMSSFYRRPDVEKKLGIKPLPISVQTQTLDSFCKKYSISHIDFLKIDTEGGELDVLRGAISLLRENKIKKLQFEYGGTYPDANITLRQVCELLSMHGYIIFRILPDGLLHIGHWHHSLENNRYSNYLAVSQEQINDYEPMNGFFGLKTKLDDKTKAKITHETDILSQLKSSGLWNEDKPLRLHLGCGQQHFDGYINIDYPPSEHTVQTSSVADVFGDITRLDFPQQSVDEIRMHHVFEHFSREVSLAMLIKWHKWLKIGGKICIETPDIEASIKQLYGQDYSYEQKQSVLRHIFGSHEADWAIHKDGWYEEKFQHVLSALEFKDINFSHSSWQTNRNITVTAKKQQYTNFERLCKVAKNLLRNDMIDESESEEKLWSIWCKNFDQFFNEINLGTTPTVSIFMPVYNGQKYLAETIESILGQTYKNFELIIADDGSTDQTLEVARAYQQRDNRIKVISLPHKGEVQARNEAIKHTHPDSKYLLNHDSDDISLPTKLEKLVEYLEEHPEIGIVGCFAEYFDDLGNCKGQPAIEYEPNRIRQTFGSVNSMINSASLVRREVFNKIGGYREEFRSTDDYDFFARALMAGFELANIPQVLHKIRLHQESICSTRAKTQKILSDKIRENYNSNSNIYSNRNSIPLEQQANYGENIGLQKEKVSGNGLKLHLGCGTIKIPGFINVDIDPNVSAVDVVDDVCTLSRFNNNSASVIYACHVLEHFGHDEIIPILKRWLEILEQGGELRISVPDTDRIVKVYINNWQHFQTPPNTLWIGLIYGGQNNKYDFHKTGFNFCYLKYLLEQAGFEHISEYPHEPHWLGIKDASLANEPFKEYLSLNIMATKVKSPNINRPNNRHNKPLRILHTVELYSPHIGGAEQVVQQLSERLAMRGHDVTVATTKLTERTFNQLNGVQIEEFDAWGAIAHGFVGNDIDRYKQFLLQHPADIMMNYAAQQWATDLAFDSLTSTKNRRVNIIAPCGYSALSDSRTLQIPEFEEYFRKILPSYIPQYDAAVYHSGQYQDYEYAQNHGFKNSVIIPNGVCEEEFLQTPKISFRNKYKITTKYMGLCVANFYRGKGQDKIIECVRQMNRPDFTMVFIGREGGELQNLHQSASGLNIKFCVGINREDTLAAYHEADIFLLGSEKECSPLVIVEAKASQTPFVSTDCGNVREWKGGIVCEPEKMAFYTNRILDDEAARMNFAEEGWKEWKEKLTWESIVDKYERLYMKLYSRKFSLKSTSLLSPLSTVQFQCT